MQKGDDHAFPTATSETRPFLAALRKLRDDLNPKDPTQQINLPEDANSLGDDKASILRRYRRAVNILNAIYDAAAPYTNNPAVQEAAARGAIQQTLETIVNWAQSRNAGPLILPQATQEALSAVLAPQEVGAFPVEPLNMLNERINRRQFLQRGLETAAAGFCAVSAVSGFAGIHQNSRAQAKIQDSLNQQSSVESQLNAAAPEQVQKTLDELMRLREQAVQANQSTTATTLAITAGASATVATLCHLAAKKIAIEATKEEDVVNMSHEQIINAAAALECALSHPDIERAFAQNTEKKERRGR